MRARRKPWAAKELSTNENVIENASEMKGRWKEFFGNENDIHVEIGCGKGRFIQQLAEQNPNLNYIAIEKENNIIATAVRDARELGRSIAFIVGDVKDLENYFAPDEIKRIYINFCDPWHRKKKWSKRRLTHKNFLVIYERIFISGGEIFFKTDNKPLFEFSLNEFSNQGWQIGRAHV